MTLSVLILSYNHSRYIEEAVSSVIQQLDYVDNIELIILDDGSTDGTREVLATLQVPKGVELRLFMNEHKGVTAIAENFNFLISQATRKYIAFLASDDLYQREAFKVQIDEMERDPAVQLVYGNGINFSNQKMLDRLHFSEVRASLASHDPARVLRTITKSVPQLYIQALLVRREFFAGFAPFDEKLIADDWAFNIRVFRRLEELSLEFRYCDDVVFRRRLLSGSTSNNLKVHFHRILQVARKYITENEKEFFAYFYMRYLKVFLRQGMLLRSFSMLFRLARLKAGSANHSRGLEGTI